MSLIKLCICFLNVLIITMCVLITKRVYNTLMNRVYIDLQMFQISWRYSTLHAFSPNSLHTPRVSTWREIKKIPLYAAFAWFWTRRLTIGKTDKPTRRPSALATRGKLRVLRDNDQFNFVWLPDFQIKLHLLQVHTCTCSIIFTIKKNNQDRSIPTWL